MSARGPGFIIGLILGFAVLSAAGPEDSGKISYGTGSWDAGALGNHRAVIRVDRGADAVFVRIPWRRRDRNPEDKAVVVIDAATGKRIRNLYCLDIRRDYGDLVFQPGTVPGVYHVYYLTHVVSGRSNYPTVTYPGRENTCDPDWLERNGLSPRRAGGSRISDFPSARVEAFQSINEFNSFYPMEVIASPRETESLLESRPDEDILLFPEERFFPIRMKKDLPLRWIEQGPQPVFQAEAARGEYLVFQIGVFAARRPIENLEVSFDPLVSEASGETLPASVLTCFNTEGVNWRGKRFLKPCPVPRGEIQPLWCGADIPEKLEPGLYRSAVNVIPDRGSPGRVSLEVTVTDDVLEDSGDDEPRRLSRLRWLNSTLALDGVATAAYTPVRFEGRSVCILGRSLEIGERGLPVSIRSRFAPEMTFIREKEREILAAPLRFEIEGAEGGILEWDKASVEPGRLSEAAYTWAFRASAGPVEITGRARMEFDGFVEYQVELSATREIEVNNIRLEIPFRSEAARFMMGMGVKGGFRPDSFSWKWNVRHNQDSVWLGDVNAGLQIGLRDEFYSRPLNTNFYLLKPLVLPASWCNQGRGGCEILEVDNGTVLVRAYSGPRRIRPGEKLRYDWTLLITPFRAINPPSQWATRFYHRFDPLDRIAATGANTVNVHHATEINPFINYPFLRPDEMRAYVDQAHARNMKVKIYYTVRELTNRAPELFALFSLGEEIFFPGQGGGPSWLQEHLEGDYIAGWYVPDLEDAAVINSGTSRWHNYYVEGLDWLARNIGIDGLYIDDVAFDRTTMKRVRRILEHRRPGAMIDLHSANQFREKDGFANSANLYLEHFPYIDRLWFGEYFDYDAPPDFWLVEVSGIPFGLMGEMLQDGGNPWRGMLFGMTARLPWAGDPRPLWKLWDEFGIQETEMVGFWVPDRPIRSDRPDVPVTSYIGEKGILIALASWAPEEVSVGLEINWRALGIRREKARFTAPHVSEFQPSAVFRPENRIPLHPGKGWLLILGEEPVIPRK